MFLRCVISTMNSAGSTSGQKQSAKSSKVGFEEGPRISAKG